MLSILRLVNVATPATAFIAVVPDSVPAAGLVPMASDTLPVKPVAVLPRASLAVTVAPKATLASDVGGEVVKTICVAGPDVMRKPALVADVSVADVATRV